MLSDILGLFVHHPLRLLAISGAMLVLWAVVRRGLGRASARSNMLLVPAVFFAAFATWEWLVMTRTPEADIRVDLLLIWPAAAIVTAWALLRVLRR